MEITLNITANSIDSVPPLNYSKWLQDWIALNKPSPTTDTVPQEAQHISFLLLPQEWKHLLETYPYQDLVTFFLQGLTEGFRISYNYTLNTLKPARTNMKSAFTHQAVVEEYIQKELTLSRMPGPFPHHSIHGGQVNTIKQTLGG